MNTRKYTAAVLTEGCKVNRCESEAIAEALEAAGFRICTADEVCDLFVINTCTVTARSDKTARQIIHSLHARCPDAVLIVTGCSAQRCADSLLKIPGVSAVVGNARKLDTVRIACELLGTDRRPDTPLVSLPPLEGCPFESVTVTRFDRIRPDIKIEDGCECRCTYCAIPDARGPVRSKPLDDVVREVTRLCAAGVREVVLTGIETGSWGRDLGTDASGGRYTLARLLTAVDAIPGVCRVRLGSLDPSVMTPAFTDTLSRLSCLAPHLHISVQSGCSRTLARMKRRYNAVQCHAALERVRAAVPGVQLTTDMIVGFPGETDADFEESLSFAESAGFLHIHVFPYSRREGTPAADMPGQVPPGVKRARAARLSAVSEASCARILDARLSDPAPVTVLFERFLGDAVTGHTPEFFEVRINTPVNLRGRELPVRLTGREGGVLCGELLQSPLFLPEGDS